MYVVDVCCDTGLSGQLVRGVEVVLGGGDEEMALSMRERVLPLLLDRYKVSLTLTSSVPFSIAP